MRFDSLLYKTLWFMLLLKHLEIPSPFVQTDVRSGNSVAENPKKWRKDSDPESGPEWLTGGTGRFPVGRSGCWVVDLQSRHMQINRSSMNINK